MQLSDTAEVADREHAGIASPKYFVWIIKRRIDR